LLKTQNNHGIINIYNGTNASAPLLGSYSGDNIPASLTINKNQAFVSFISDADTVKQGFFINYKASTPNYCSAYKVLTANSGTFTDGSESKKYNSNTYCKWNILPTTTAGSITLHFNNFSTEANKDILKVKLSFPDTILATFSGNTIPQDFTIYAEEAILEWITDYENEFQGWEISYTSSGVGINNIAGMESMLIYPNPVEEILNISMNITKKQNIVCELYSMEISLQPKLG